MVKHRSRARAVTSFVCVLVALGALFSACTETKRQFGEECLKDDDCITNICRSQRCDSIPPYQDASPLVPDSTSDASPEGSTSEGGGDTGGGQSDGGDAGDADGPGADVQLEGSDSALADATEVDAPSDGPIVSIDASLDVSADAQLDVFVD